MSSDDAFLMAGDRVRFDGRVYEVAGLDGAQTESAMSVTLSRGRCGSPRKLANSLASFLGDPFGGAVI